jgi:outer membrane murein-binding lipoprotein Lpp
MTGRIKLIMMIVAAALLLSGCTAKISNYSLLSTKLVDLDAQYAMVAEDATAITSQLWVLLYFDMDHPSYYKALGDCLAENDGDLMTDVQITTSSYFFLLGYFTEFRVTGNVWKRVDALTAGAMNAADLYTLNEVGGRQLLVSDSGDAREVAMLD